MEYRNLSPQTMFLNLAREHRPECAFAGKDRAAFDAWKAATWPRVRDCLGRSPERVPPRPERLAAWEHDGVRKERWILDVQPHLSAVLQINFPGNPAKDERLPAILAWNGHGPFGKEPVMGNDGSEALRAAIRMHNYNYGHVMAKAGFVTYAIDWIGCGERNDTTKPNYYAAARNRDWCNLYYLHATMLGMTSISINVAHGKVATDFVASLPEVDPTRLGVMGLSAGGTMTVWSLLCDERLRAGEIICYSDLWAAFGMRDINYCGMQVAPGLFRLVDLPDLQGLIAPRPLLIDIGAYDSCFKVDTALDCYRQLERIYEAAGAPLELDLFPGEHGWGGNRSVSFFNRHLAYSPQSAVPESSL